MIVSKKPSELGIPKEFEVPQINIYGCPIGIHFAGGFAQAHTHIDPRDEYFKNICYTDPKFIILPSGEPHDLFYHEYAHTVAVKDFDHGEKWRKVLRDLGKSDIGASGPFVVMPTGMRLLDVLTGEYWVLDGIGLNPDFRRLGEVA